MSEYLNQAEKFFSENPSYKRHVRNFETYQALLAEEKTENLPAIKTRMHELFITPLEERDAPLKHSAQKVATEMLRACEQNEFSSKKFLAAILAHHELAAHLLKTWDTSYQREQLADKNRFPINNVLTYTPRSDHGIDIHVEPTDSSAVNIRAQIMHGFRELAERLSSEQITADHIKMKSWLLGSSLEKIARHFFGDSITFNPSDPDDKEVSQIQLTAIEHNTRMQKEYLRTGQKPEVRLATFSRDEWISRFKPNPH